MVNFDIYTLVATSSLIIQIAVLTLLVRGYFLKRKLKFRQHGKTMAAAVFLHLAMIFGIMIPSFVVITTEYIVPSPTVLISIATLVHALAGSIAAALGVGLVTAWRFKKDFAGCFARKRFMVTTFIVWIAAITLGLMLYAVFYGSAWIN
jgi:uncharacterized membrane protein YozB (DUF420 family)